MKRLLAAEPDKAYETAVCAGGYNFVGRGLIHGNHDGMPLPAGAGGLGKGRASVFGGAEYTASKRKGSVSGRPRDSGPG